MKEQPIPSPENGLWRFFSSIKLTVVTLLTLAATSIVGTLIPQNEGQAAYVHQFGETGYRVMYGLGLFDVYHSPWFRFLLIVLTVNIVVCSVDRLPGVWKIVAKKPSFKPGPFKKAGNRREFTLPGAPEDHREAILSTVKGYPSRIVEEVEGGFAVIAEKGRWTRLGVYGVHLSVVLLLLGGLIGSFFGYSGYVAIPEGESADRIELKQTGAVRVLPFTIRCDDFNVKFYESGAPEEFRSSLAIVKDGREVMKKDIVVNSPLRYGGVNIYQSSYGSMAGNSATLSFISRDSGMQYEHTATFGEKISLPEGLGELVLQDYSPSFGFQGHNIGEAFIATLTPKGGEPREILLPIRFANFDKMRGGKVIVSVKDFEKRHYTGLQVNRDPGVAVVYTGFILMIAGCWITFFLSHQRVFVEATVKGNKTQVAVAASANRNRPAADLKVERLADRLQKQA